MASEQTAKVKNGHMGSPIANSPTRRFMAAPGQLAAVAAGLFQRKNPPLPILQPYVVTSGGGGAARWARRFVPVAFVLFCFIWGVGFAFFAPFLIPLFLFPIGLLAVLTIWALPDSKTAPIKTLAVLFWFLLGGLELWPNYLALALPGLPWITMIRLSGIPLSFILLICVSTSKSFRSELASSLRSAPVLTWLLVGFTVLETLSIGVSRQPFFSVDRVLVDSMSWTVVFFVSAYLFRVPGRIERWAAALWAMAVILCCIGLLEWRQHHVFWFGHVPSFFKMARDSPVEVILGGTIRAANGIYRVQSTSSTPIGLAEYLSLALPFVMHFAAQRYSLLVRLCAAATIPVLFVVMVATDSRSGMIGALLAVLIYPLAMAVLRWRHHRESIFGPAISLIYPAVFGVAGAAVLFVGRIHKAVLGGGAQQISTDGRIVQYHMGMPMVWHHPWGYGAGTGAMTLGFIAPGSDKLTIDTYYLMIALEYGVVGFLVFYAMFAWGVAQAGILAFRHSHKERDYSFLLPISIALLEFIVIKSVFSQQDNHPIVFMMLGAVAALAARIKDGSSASAPAMSPSPLRQGTSAAGVPRDATA